MTKDPNEIGALWKKKTRNGVVFFSGQIKVKYGQGEAEIMTIPLVIWENGYKRAAHHPDYIVKISNYTPPARGGENGKQETGDSGEFAGSSVDDGCPF